MDFHTTFFWYTKNRANLDRQRLSARFISFQLSKMGLYYKSIIIANCIENDGYLANPEFINKIFKSGYTSKKNQEGHGLGLSILKSKIRKYNGDITVCTTYHDEKTYLSIEVEI